MKRYTIHDVDFDFVDIDDSTERETVPGNTYEPALTGLLHEIFSNRERGTFLDIGALYGYFSCYVGKLAPGVRVMAFEPCRRSVMVLAENLKLNKLSNVAVEPVALASAERTQELMGKTLVKDAVHPRRLAEAEFSLSEVELDRRSLTGGRVSLATWLWCSVKHLLRHLRGWNRKEVVDCVSFDGRYDGLCESPVVVKIDVHGAEVGVLKGMQRFLGTNVDVLFLELHRDDMLVEGTHQDTVDLLHGSGLGLYEIVDFRSDEKWRLVKITPETARTLSSSRHWSLTDKTAMKMVLGVREGAFDVENHKRTVSCC